jgi:uncharacterized phage-associated protein
VANLTAQVSFRVRPSILVQIKDPSMRLRFRETKATQAAARLLQHRGGEMNYMKLIKLLYIVEREALRRWGRPVTGDRCVSLPKGPVLSQTLNLINDGPVPDTRSVWAEHISQPDNYSVRLLSPLGDDELSEAEKALIDEVFQCHGSMNRWALVDLVHTFPEWQDPDGSALPITYRDILRAGGKTELEVAAILQDIEAVAEADVLFPAV